MLHFQEASEKLVNAYNQLRQRDSQSSTKSTWRITVRQLESLIRLSEANAKMECSDHVSSYFILLFLKIRLSKIIFLLLKILI